MILYNVTTNIHESAHKQWFDWMQEVHIPKVLATGKFSSARMVRVLVEEELGGLTYAVQYTTDSKETLENIIWKMRLDCGRKPCSFLPIKHFPSERS